MRLILALIALALPAFGQSGYPASVDTAVRRGDV